MSVKKKTDPMIGVRAAQEFQRLFPVKKDGDLALGCGKHTVYEWTDGTAPSAVYLQRLMELGADIDYILCGVKRNSFHDSDKYMTINVQELIERLYILSMAVSPNLRFLIGCACGFLERYRTRISELEKIMEEHNERR